MSVSTKQQRIARLAREHPEWSFTSLAHYIDLEWLREAYRRTRKDAVPGIDGQTADEYAENLEENLRSLLERMKSGKYQAPPVKRAHILKGQGPETRPIGIPTFEDKVLQRAVVMVLEPIYEQDFKTCSYGFRPGRSQHEALRDLWSQMMGVGGGTVADGDIRKCFDTLDHARTREFVKRRVRDGVLMRLISKWLAAGVLEDGSLSFPESGTPQGGVISPLLSNIYLHEVLDKWFEEVVKPRMRGRAFLIRYADDFVMGFEDRQDAERVMAVLPKRFAKYGLTLHPDKTRLVPFDRPRWGRGGRKRKESESAKPGTFDFLGFTHHWGLSRRGRWVVRQKTASSRLTRAIRGVYAWCRKNRHEPVQCQWEALCRKVRGHYEYFGVTGNGPSLRRFLTAVERAWRKWLDRRSRDRAMPWERFKRLLERYRLPPARVAKSVYAVNP
jgi:group II intron reverse transcriptase/maturase